MVSLAALGADLRYFVLTNDYTFAIFAMGFSDFNNQVLHILLKVRIVNDDMLFN